MRDTCLAERGLMDDTRIRLRTDIYDQAVAAKGVKSINEQVSLTGISRSTLWRIRRGESPNLVSAIRISDALGVPLQVLFERVDT